MLKVQNLSIGYHTPLIKDIHFDIKAGELVAILGRNGAGKTTLLKTLTGFLKPLNGNILIQQQDFKSLSASALAKKISIVNTERIRMNYFSVQDFLELGRFPHTNFIGKLEATDIEVVQQVIEWLKIEPLISKYLNQLSDGELQKVLIGRALVQDTPIILLDEPTTHLDLVNRFQIFKLLQQLCKTTQKAIILSTHEVELALDLADKIILMDENHQLKVASKATILQNDWIAKTFQQEGVFFDSQTRRFRYLEQ
jgi:iron complex transport system ATP-binding protein